MKGGNDEYDDELQDIFKDPRKLARETIRRHRDRNTPTKEVRDLQDEIEEQERQRKRDIFNYSRNPQKQLRKEFPDEIKAELKEHDQKRRLAAELGERVPSTLIPIPEPNPRGGMKRKTKRKRSMKKNKKSKKQKGKRRTNKKRSNKKRKTRKIKGGNNYQKCIDKCNKEFSDALHKAQDIGVPDDIVLGIHKKRQNCHNVCRTSDAEIDGGKRKSKKSKRKTRRRK